MTDIEPHYSLACAVEKLWLERSHEPTNAAVYLPSRDDNAVQRDMDELRSASFRHKGSGKRRQGDRPVDAEPKAERRRCSNRPTALSSGCPQPPMQILSVTASPIAASSTAANEILEPSDSSANSSVG